MVINKMKGKGKRILFLDDRSKRIRSAIDKWDKENSLTICCRAKECIKLISLGQWDYISLDYDLDFNEFTPLGEPGTGMDVIDFICENIEFLRQNFFRPTIIIHSANPGAAYWMKRKLLEAGVHATYERWIYDE